MIIMTTMTASAKTLPDPQKNDRQDFDSSITHHRHTDAGTHAHTHADTPDSQTLLFPCMHASQHQLHTSCSMSREKSETPDKLISRKISY